MADRLGHGDPALALRVYTHGTQDQVMAAALYIAALALIFGFFVAALLVAVVALGSGS